MEISPHYEEFLKGRLSKNNQESKNLKKIIDDIKSKFPS
jgi:hypothetical protein